MKIGRAEIGPGKPTYIIAEMSANHGNSLNHAMDVVSAAKESGANAIKLQTYTADTLTLACDRQEFRIGRGTLLEGRTLYDLYQEAHTPWEWHYPLFELANKLGLDCFSTPFDRSAVEFLESLNPPAYKIASFELVDLPLIEFVASKGRPIIMSTGMGSLAEISEAVAIVKKAKVALALLKCTSAYPALPESMNLLTIPNLASTFSVPAGLSDHTLGGTVPIAAVTLGARVIEKHFTLSRDEGGPDSSFSMEPQEFKAMVNAVRSVEKALGSVTYDLTDSEEASRIFRRSLFIAEDVCEGDKFTEQNVRSIRPGQGLSPKFLPEIIGRIARRPIAKGTPLSWDCIL